MKYKMSQEFRKEIYDYIAQWKQEESWTDYNQIHMMADLVPDGLEYACDYMVNSGAIEPEHSFNPEIETAIVVLSERFKKYSKKRKNLIFERLFDGCFVASCNDCNHCSFLSDGNEDLYPETKTECWECKSTDIETDRIKGIK